MTGGRSGKSVATSLNRAPITRGSSEGWQEISHRPKCSRLPHSSNPRHSNQPCLSPTSGKTSSPGPSPSPSSPRKTRSSPPHPHQPPTTPASKHQCPHSNKLSFSNPAQPSPCPCLPPYKCNRSCNCRYNNHSCSRNINKMNFNHSKLNSRERCLRISRR